MLDLVLFEGSHVLLHTSIALLRQAEPTLLAAWDAAHDAGALFRALKRVGERIVDADALVDATLALASTSTLRLPDMRGNGVGNGSGEGGGGSVSVGAGAANVLRRVLLRQSARGAGDEIAARVLANAEARVLTECENECKAESQAEDQGVGEGESEAGADDELVLNAVDSDTQQHAADGTGALALARARSRMLGVRRECTCADGGGAGPHAGLIEALRVAKRCEVDSEFRAMEVLRKQWRNE